MRDCLALAAVLAFAALLAWITPAWPHDNWISRNKLTDPLSKEWCCNQIDCRTERVREVAGGYVVETGEFVPASRVIWKSEDGAWWRCRNLSTNATRCLIGPPPGS